jgi:hypothetical protein
MASLSNTSHCDFGDVRLRNEHIMGRNGSDSQVRHGTPLWPNGIMFDSFYCVTMTSTV